MISSGHFILLDFFSGGHIVFVIILIVIVFYFIVKPYFIDPFNEGIKGNNRASEIPYSSPETTANYQIRCPKCGSTSIHVDKKGYSAGKGCCGYAACGPLGFLFGQAGANKIRKTCLHCNNSWI